MQINLRHSVNEEKLRSYSSAFSRSVFSDIAFFSDFTHLNWILSHYKESFKEGSSYMDFLSYMYSAISKFYRCEYVYKNEIINQLLLKKYGTKHTIAFNEFKVGDSIVDLAMMNGESKAFEIKTTLDSPKRLGKQMTDYKKLFDKSYIVVDEKECAYYAEHVEEGTGVVSLSFVKGRIVLEEYKPATKHEDIDVFCLMKCLRISEYENIVRTYFGELPDVPRSVMYDFCREQMCKIPYEVLNSLFLAEIKKRKSVTKQLKSFPKEIRQIMLALNLPENKQEILITNLNKPINREYLCTTRF